MSASPIAEAQLTRQTINQITAPGKLSRGLMLQLAATANTDGTWADAFKQLATTHHYTWDDLEAFVVWIEKYVPWVSCFGNIDYSAIQWVFLCAKRPLRNVTLSADRVVDSLRVARHLFWITPLIRKKKINPRDLQKLIEAHVPVPEDQTLVRGVFNGTIQTGSGKFNPGPVMVNLSKMGFTSTHNPQIPTLSSILRRTRGEPTHPRLPAVGAQAPAVTFPPTVDVPRVGAALVAARSEEHTTDQRAATRAAPTEPKGERVETPAAAGAPAANEQPPSPLLAPPMELTELFCTQLTQFVLDDFVLLQRIRVASAKREIRHVYDFALSERISAAVCARHIAHRYKNPEKLDVAARQLRSSLVQHGLIDRTGGQKGPMHRQVWWALRAGPYLRKLNKPLDCVTKPLTEAEAIALLREHDRDTNDNWKSVPCNSGLPLKGIEQWLKPGAKVPAPAPAATVASAAVPAAPVLVSTPAVPALAPEPDEDHDATKAEAAPTDDGQSQSSAPTESATPDAIHQMIERAVARLGGGMQHDLTAMLRGEVKEMVRQEVAAIGDRLSGDFQTVVADEVRKAVELKFTGTERGLREYASRKIEDELKILIEGLQRELGGTLKAEVALIVGRMVEAAPVKAALPDDFDAKLEASVAKGLQTLVPKMAELLADELHRKQEAVVEAERDLAQRRAEAAESQATLQAAELLQRALAAVGRK